MDAWNARPSYRSSTGLHTRPLSIQRHLSCHKLNSKLLLLLYRWCQTLFVETHITALLIFWSNCQGPYLKLSVYFNILWNEPKMSDFLFPHKGGGQVLIEAFIIYCNSHHTVSANTPHRQPSILVFILCPTSQSFSTLLCFPVHYIGSMLLLSDTSLHRPPKQQLGDFFLEIELYFYRLELSLMIIALVAVAKANPIYRALLCQTWIKKWGWLTSFAAFSL